RRFRWCRLRAACRRRGSRVAADGADERRFAQIRPGDEMKGCWIHKTIGLGAVVAILAIVAQAKESMPDMPAPPPPPIPKITGLQLLPDKVTISDGRDTRRVLVMGLTESGKPVDLTASAQLKSDSKA